ncbi:MAG TPA: sugar phosphate isomerase/epimerase [Bryobacteraceae bacterium]|nr:sugar phosphate isomerase/epimerase [Bryobacteraceae bacterium]
MSTSLTRRAMLASTAGAALALKAFAKVNGVELGVCGKPTEVAETVQYGYDYLEPSAATVAALSDADFNAFRDQLKASKTYCRSFNILFSRGQKIDGPTVDLDAIMKYLDTTFARCKESGAKVVVWGSSGSRNVPPDFSRDKAWDQIKEFLKPAGDVAKKHDIVIGIEFLRHQESNIINTGAEALKLLTEVNHPNVQMIVDYYHLATEKEDPDIIRKAKDHIVHMHFANPAGRRWPHSVDEDPGYAGFFKAVKDIKYTGGLSIEGNGSFDADGAASMEFFKKELA